VRQGFSNANCGIDLSAQFLEDSGILCQKELSTAKSSRSGVTSRDDRKFGIEDKVLISAFPSMAGIRQ
jgi:hypothetical protein